MEEDSLIKVRSLFNEEGQRELGASETNYKNRNFIFLEPLIKTTR